MQTRRSIFFSLAGAVAVARMAAAAAESDRIPAKLVPGNPSILDYGEGVKVPCNKGAFLTLWEGDTFWLTFGFGTSPQSERAKGEATHHAIGAMKYLLLTLAFAPDRLQKVEGNGWRQKVESPANYVLGELELPGRPGVPATDAFMGFGNADQNVYWGGAPTLGGPSGVVGASQGAQTGINPAMMLNKAHAFCSYVVKKVDLDLNAVRARARFVQL